MEYLSHAEDSILTVQDIPSSDLEKVEELWKLQQNDIKGYLMSMKLAVNVKEESLGEYLLYHQCWIPLAKTIYGRPDVTLETVKAGWTHTDTIRQASRNVCAHLGHDPTAMDSERLKYVLWMLYDYSRR